MLYQMYACMKPWCSLQYHIKLGLVHACNHYIGGTGPVWDVLDFVSKRKRKGLRLNTVSLAVNSAGSSQSGMPEVNIVCLLVLVFKVQL